MAGITDRPFRQCCREFGAGLVYSEMVSSKPDLRASRKTQLRLNYQGEPGPKAVQIVGADPDMLASSARFNVDNGADIIDINMGCPAKKVCSVASGSALLKNENLVAEILQKVVSAVAVPVTLKIRTGWDVENRNALRIAKLAEDAGIAALSIHGRTRADKFSGEAEYETIAHVKTNISIPVIANGDIDSAQKAQHVLKYTQADAIMVGRAAQGRPWIFKEINHYLATGELLVNPHLDFLKRTLVNHLQALYDFYGDFMGVRIARKHIAWYLKDFFDFKKVKQIINQAQMPEEQLGLVEEFLLTEVRREVAA